MANPRHNINMNLDFSSQRFCDALPGTFTGFPASNP
jgi:hypothetical protein